MRTCVATAVSVAGSWPIIQAPDCRRPRSNAIASTRAVEIT